MTNDAKGTSTAARKRAPAKTAAKRAAPAARARTAPPSPGPGWYEDPAEPEMQRYWDGEGWTGPAVSASIDLSGRGPNYNTQALTDAAPAAAGAASPGAGRISFRGRSMRVHDLSIEQIGVWRRIVTQLEDANLSLPPEATEETVEARNKAVKRSLDRCLNMVISVLVDEPDQDWIETQLLTGQLKLEEAINIIKLSIDAFTSRRRAGGDEGASAANRADRRSQPKARRRD